MNMIPMLFKVRLDYGKSGDEDIDEIDRGEGGSLMDETFDARQIMANVCGIEEYGKTNDFLRYGSTDISIHEIGAKKLEHCFLDSELVKLNLPSQEKKKLQPPYTNGDWYGIRPVRVVALHPSAQVTCFDGPGVKKKVYREVKSYALPKDSLDGVFLLRIEFHGGDYFCSHSFKEAYEKAGLTGLKFIDTNCKFI